jgi:sugar phosphate isomerase/epimerase
MVEDLRLGTIAILRKLVLLQNDWKHRYRFALENQRVKGSVNPGRSFDGILSMCDEIDSPAVGICWDFGHGVANHIKNSLPLYPPKEFLAACIHTHIHDLGPSGATHWPFAENVVPLEDFGGLLVAQAYKGVFNLELGFDRFGAVKGKWDLLAASISRLRQLGAN